MKFSTGLPGINLYPPITNDWERSLRPGDYQLVARTADELGFHSLAIPEHIVIPNDMVSLMGPSWSHTMTAMSFVAGATSRIVVDSSVIVLPYHDPVGVRQGGVDARRAVGRARARVSIGVGHAEREFEILRVPFHERGEALGRVPRGDHRALDQRRAEFHGTYVDFADVAFEPKPVQQPHPPIWIGGNSRAAMRRAAASRRLVPLADHRRRDPGVPRLRARAARLRRAHATVRRGAAAHHARRSTRITGRSTVTSAAPTSRPAPRPTIDAVGHLLEVGVTCTSIPTPPTRSLDEHLDHPACGWPRRSSPRSRSADHRTLDWLDDTLGAVRSRKGLDVSWGTLVTMQHPRQYAQTAPDRPAAIDAESGAIRTYAELDERASRLAHAVRGAGLHTGDHIAIVMDNRLEYFEVLWGAMRVGPLRHADELAPRRRRGELHRRRLRRAGARGRGRRHRRSGRRSGRRRAPLRLASAASSRASTTTRRALAAQPDGTDRRRGRGQLDVLLVGHHRPAEGHQAADDRRAARRRRTAFSALVGGLFGVDRGLGVPVPRAAVPRRAGRLVDDACTASAAPSSPCTASTPKRAWPRSSATA